MLASHRRLFVLLLGTVVAAIFVPVASPQHQPVFGPMPRTIVRLVERISGNVIYVKTGTQIADALF